MDRREWKEAKQRMKNKKLRKSVGQEGTGTDPQAASEGDRCLSGEQGMGLDNPISRIVPVCPDSRGEYEISLLTAIRAFRPRLEQLLEEMGAIWCYEDGIYRFYYQSFKVYSLQHYAEAAMRLFSEIGAAAAIEDFALHPEFCRIVNDGTGITFEPEHNQSWSQVTRPIVEAFLHARYFVEMHVKYGRILEHPPQPMPSGWAAVLCLYKIR